MPKPDFEPLDLSLIIGVCEQFYLAKTLKDVNAVAHRMKDVDSTEDTLEILRKVYRSRWEEVNVQETEDRHGVQGDVAGANGG